MATKQETVEHEHWKSVINGKVAVNRFDHAGQIVQEIVGPGRTVILTSKERQLLNTDRTIDEKDDAFKNGTLIPLTPIAMADSAGELVENPNHMTENDLRELFELRNHKQFKAAVNQITSEPALRKLLSLARSGDEELNVTVNQERLVAEAYAEQTDQIFVEEVEQVPASSFSSAVDQDRSMVGKVRKD